MTDDERKRLKEYIERWKETGKVLEKLRREEIRKTVTSQTLPVFDDALASALYLQKASSTSGFVQMYKILEKSR